MTGTLEDRLTELEVRLAFVDDTMNVLNDTVAAHEQQLLEMRLAMDRLRSELVAMRGSLTQDARDEPPPPHY
ncbi:SlyX family protein [Dokdonella ginsengisoli]|uniref:Protein SlyX homolog n=1 Tax=Dokdonella ginsengisoli TaxID=363846 RepID=A0ABV9QYV7_9GAMM